MKKARAPEPCLVAGCINGGRRRLGLCEMHYSRSKRDGNMKLALATRRKQGTLKVVRVRLTKESINYYRAQADNRSMSLEMHITSILEAVRVDHYRRQSEERQLNAWSKRTNPMEEA